MKYIFTCCLFLLSVFNYSQTFTGGGGAILDFQTLDVPLNVNLPQNAINTTNFGVESICLNLTHTWLADLTIQIIAPDGTTKMLVSGVGGGEDNLVNTCFSAIASQPIQSGIAPFTGTFKPMGQMGAVNNGQNPNGTWTLRVIDSYGQDEGEVQNWSITFGNNPAEYFQFSESNLPIVVLQTGGQTIQYDVKTVVDMGIIYNGPGNRNYLVDPFNEYDGKIGLEYRGNYSYSLPQKPYSLELRDASGLIAIDSSLLGMPAESDWILLANYNDKSFARNELPYELFDSMGHYGVRSRHVDVVLDGEYQGIYLLTERIKRDINRIDIANLEPFETIGQDLTGGYIIKIDYWDNNNSWQSNFSPIGYPGLDIHFVYHYPNATDIVLQQKTYIQNFMNEFETALYSADFKDPIIGYRKYIDVPSFIDYFIVNEVARNGDGFKKSRFLWKDKDYVDGTYRKLHEGPVWDFDWALKDIWSGSEDGSGFMFDIVDQDVHAPGWYIRLLQDTIFANELRCRYDDLRRNLLSESNLHQKIDSIAAVVSESQEWHYLTWGHLGAATGTPETQAPSLTYSEEVQRLKDWITRRLNWLDIHMPGTLNGCSMTALKENQAFDFEAYPNPFHSSVHLQLTSTYKGHGQIRLLDARGIAVKVEEINTTGSTQNFELNDLNELSSGIYFLEITLDSSKNIVKLIK